MIEPKRLQKLANTLRPDLTVINAKTPTNLIRLTVIGILDQHKTSLGKNLCPADLQQILSAANPWLRSLDQSIVRNYAAKAGLALVLNPVGGNAYGKNGERQKTGKLIELLEAGAHWDELKNKIYPKGTCVNPASNLLKLLQSFSKTCPRDKRHLSTTVTAIIRERCQHRAMATAPMAVAEDDD